MPGTPVSLQWSREEDMQQGRYRPVALVNLRGRAGLAGQLGRVERAPGRSVDRRDADPHRRIKNGVDPMNTRCFQDCPYAVPNFANEYAMRNTHVPPGSGARCADAQSVLSRVLHRRAGARGRQGSVQFRRPLLQGKKDLPVLDAVAKAADWGKPLGEGRASRHRGGRLLRQLHRGGGRDLRHRRDGHRGQSRRRRDRLRLRRATTTR